jgi:hypothetical protein
MPKPPITTFSSVAVKPVPTNNNNGLYAPQLTTAEIGAIPEDTLQNGLIAYDTTDNRLKTRVNGIVQQINTGVGAGDVVGPGAGVNNNIPVFDGITGKLLKDSGVPIAPVPALFLQNHSTIESNLLVNEIGNLGHIRFTNGAGTIFVDALSPVGFYLNDFGPDSQICSVFTGGIPEGTTNPSCLVELNSTTGALVLSRLDTEEIEALFATPGMILFNKNTHGLNYHDGTDWIDPSAITLIGAVSGAGSGSDSIETFLAPIVECQDREQVFLSPITDDYFVIRIQNQALLPTSIEIGAADAPKIAFIYDPIDLGLAYLQCNGVSFAVAQDGYPALFIDNIGNIGIGTSGPTAPLQFASTLGNRKIVLYELEYNDDHRFLGFGVNDDILRYQVAATTNDHVFYAGINSTTSTELFRVAGTGFVGIGNSSPHAPLQFASTLANRKIVLYELGNNDNEFLGFGTQSNILRYQVATPNNDHIFYAATSSTTSNELLRITGDGRVGIGGIDPIAPLQFTNALVNRKIVLYTLFNDDHQFFGFGSNINIARYQVPNTISDHVFYAGTSSTTSNELARISGTGNIKAAADLIANGDIYAVGTIYGMRPSGTLFATSGSPFTTVTGDNWTKISATMIPMGSTNLFSTGVNNRLTYTGSPSISILAILDVSLTANIINTNYSISIYKNGVMILGSNTPMTAVTLGYNTVSTSGRTTLNNGDYIEAWIRSNSNENVATATVILSVIAT